MRMTTGKDCWTTLARVKLSLNFIKPYEIYKLGCVELIHLSKVQFHMSKNKNNIKKSSSLFESSFEFSSDVILAKHLVTN